MPPTNLSTALEQLQADAAAVRDARTRSRAAASARAAAEAADTDAGAEYSRLFIGFNDSKAAFNLMLERALSIIDPDAPPAVSPPPFPGAVASGNTDPRGALFGTVVGPAHSNFDGSTK